MIQFYCEEEKMRFKNILTNDGGDYVFSYEFLEWCKGRKIVFKSKYLDTGEHLEIPVKKLSRKLWRDTLGDEDSLVMDEDTAILFKLTWL